MPCASRDELPLQQVTPEYSSPSRITGMSSAGNACHVSFGSSRTGTAGSTGKLRRLAVTAISAICTMPSRRPGMTPPMNR